VLCLCSCMRTLLLLSLRVRCAAQERPASCSAHASWCRLTHSVPYSHLNLTRCDRPQV
jgi:hypothetical protein